MPIGIAIVAGALAGVNPCGFPLLPAFLSLYIGADEESLPRASSRVAQGLTVGMLVTTGFLGVFLVVGIPISYGASQLTKSIPWSGLALGALLLVAGVAVVAGHRLPFMRQPQFTAGRTRRARTIVVFGAAYAVCSMSCTLPVFLAVIGASLATAGPFEAATVFGAYALGMATMLMALSLGAALLRDGLARRLKRLLPYMHRIAGVMLAFSGAYLFYYWARVLWAPADARVRSTRGRSVGLCHLGAAQRRVGKRAAGRVGGRRRGRRGPRGIAMEMDDAVAKS
ncbi:MAG: cytochrome c biogenesis CcdA family protein [Actinomycetota bacterium]|nr:cytochrome c biogenesis CcdA family protein [Actinomycetota bacterium]